MRDSASTSSPDAISAIHASPARGVLAVTGGGSGAIAALLKTPGASQTVLEAIVPYAQGALMDWVGGLIDSACSEATARAMAMRSFQRAIELNKGHFTGLFGIGCTASLASDRPKRGAHRLHVALQTHEQTAAWSLTLEKDRRTRLEEEAVATNLVLHATACAAGLRRVGLFTAGERDSLTSRSKVAPPLWWNMITGDYQTALIQPAVHRHRETKNPRCEQVLFPGAFAPPHAGHQKMVEIAEQRLDRRVTLELSLSNVDKPPIDYLAIDDRLRAIAQVFGDREVWLTRLPTFQQKAHQLGVKVFVVGADTLLRIADPRYYEDSPERRDAAIEELQAGGQRFLVFGRSVEGKFQSLDDLSIPATLRAICDGVSEAEFREEISSTDLRSQDRT